jgi:hypothetical protein
MVGLVDDQKVEVIADPLHMAVGALESGHRHGLQCALTVPETAHRSAVELADNANPLFEKSPGGNQAQRPKAGPGHGGDGQEGLAGTGGKDHDAPSSAELPGAERGLLIRAQIDRRPSGRLGSRGPSLVPGPNPATSECFANIVVATGRSPIGANPGIPQDARKILDPGTGPQPAKEDRAAVETENET